MAAPQKRKQPSSPTFLPPQCAESCRQSRWSARCRGLRTLRPQAGITPVQPVSAGILAPAPAAQPAASPLTAAATLAVTPAAATPSAAVPSVQTATAPFAEASNAAPALTNTPARTEAPAQTPENPLTAAIEQPQTAGAVNLNLSEVRQKNGAIGTQGVSETGIRDC